MQLNTAVEIVKPYLCFGQLYTMSSAKGGKEREFFNNLFKTLAVTIHELPARHKTQGQGEHAVACLHYRCGTSHWYVVEKGNDTEPAYGLSILGGDLGTASFGDINIHELTAMGIELDLRWQAKSVGRILSALEMVFA